MRARESKRVTRARGPATRTVLTWPVCIRAHMHVCAVTTGLVTTVAHINIMLLTLVLSSPPNSPRTQLLSVRNPIRARAGVSSTTESQGMRAWIQAPQMQTGQGRSLSPPSLTHSLHGPGNGRVDSQPVHPSGAQTVREFTSRTGAVSISASSSSDHRFFHF
jgi:hypothetical protein